MAIFVWGFAACCINFGERRLQEPAPSAASSAWWGFRPPLVVPSNNGTRLARGQPVSVPPTVVASLPALPLPAAAIVFFLNKMAAPKDPIVVSEEAYAVQVRSRTGLDADAVMAALAGGLSCCWRVLRVAAGVAALGARTLIIGRLRNNAWRGRIVWGLARQCNPSAMSPTPLPYNPLQHPRHSLELLACACRDQGLPEGRQWQRGALPPPQQRPPEDGALRHGSGCGGAEAGAHHCPALQAHDHDLQGRQVGAATAVLLQARA